MDSINSTDGATIAFTTQGEGDLVLLVHGGPNSSDAWAPVLPHLESSFRVVAMDRRGRGRSTDGARYSLDLEAADIASVIDAAGGSAHVVAHSSGARMALLAAVQGADIRSLVLYEPPLALERLPADLFDRVEELVLAGDKESAAEMFLKKIGAAPEEIEAVKGFPPAWQRVCASIGTVPREARAMLAAGVDKDALRQVDQPVLILIGEKTVSPLFLDGLDDVQEALQGTRRAVIPGQRHFATAFAPRELAELVKSFLASTG